MFINHFKLEYALNERDASGKGLVTVSQLQEILSTNDFNFPPEALNTVFREMLDENIQNVDPNCVIKIQAFMESLKSQFEIEQWLA